MTTQYLQTSVSQWVGKDTHACRVTKIEMHEDFFMFSANHGDSSMEEEDLQGREIEEA